MGQEMLNLKHMDVNNNNNNHLKKIGNVVFFFTIQKAFQHKPTNRNERKTKSRELGKNGGSAL